MVFHDLGHVLAGYDVDLTEGYDIFANKDRPLDEVRAELGIPPLQRMARASSARALLTPPPHAGRR
jgi:hypothetical protein